MYTIRRTLLAAIAAVGVTLSPQALALNPQPEVPSKNKSQSKTRPKALNPQPEVPSKAGQKKKKKTKQQEKKKLSQPSR